MLGHIFDLPGLGRRVENQLLALSNFANLEAMWEADMNVYATIGGTTDYNSDPPTYDGNNAAEWKDQTATAYAATQATGTAQAIWRANQINSQPSMDFDGGDYYENSAAAAIFEGDDTPFSVFLVFQPDSVAVGTQNIFGVGNSGASNPTINVRIINDVLDVLRRDTTGALVNVGTGTVSAIAPNLVTVLFTGTTVTIRINGATEDNAVAMNVATLGTLNQFRIASRGNSTAASFLAGQLPLLAIYSDVKSEADYQAIETIIASKYGITLPF